MLALNFNEFSTMFKTLQSVDELEEMLERRRMLQLFRNVSNVSSLGDCNASIEDLLGLLPRVSEVCTGEFRESEELSFVMNEIKKTTLFLQRWRVI